MIRWKRLLWLIALAAVAVVSYLAGVASHQSNLARADVTVGPVPKSFESGGARTIPILTDISTTLKSIDQRVARLEKLAALEAQRNAAQPK